MAYVGEIGSRYARALYDFAAGNGREETVYHEVRQAVARWRTDRRLRELIASPIRSTTVKTGLLVSLAEGGASEEFARFAALVVRHRRERWFGFMLHSYISLYRREKGISEAVMTSAVPFDAALGERIRRQIEEREGCEVEMRTEVDESLVGGFRFRMDDILLDASVATQIARLREELGGK